jgi:Protein of unknown function (DUF2400).
MEQSELKDFLDEKAAFYNNPKFIESDPIQIPHQFTKKEDVEIAAFLVATIAWGNRKSIISNGTKLMERMGNAPYDFVMNFSEKDTPALSGFVHRTFNELDLEYFVRSLQNIYINHGGLESLFTKYAEADTLQPAIHHLKKLVL